MSDNTRSHDYTHRDVADDDIARIEAIPNYQGMTVERDADGQDRLVVLVDEKRPEAELADDAIVPDSVETEDGDRLSTRVESAGVFGVPPRPEPVSDNDGIVDTIVGGVLGAIRSALPKVREYLDTAEERYEGVLARVLYGEPVIDRTARHRPLVPSLSIGPKDRPSAGTVGGFFLDEDGQLVGLTNAHVVGSPDAEPGLTIIQPGRYDQPDYEHDPDDVIGELAETTTLKPHSEGDTISDSALVAIDDDIDVDAHVMPGLGEEVGADATVAGFDTNPPENAVFVKVGRTTNERRSSLRKTDVRTAINYHATDEFGVLDGMAVFDDMSAGGDSGSLIGYVTGDDEFYITHLLFAGSQSSTIGIPIERVFEVHGELRLPPTENDGKNGGGSDG